MHISPFLDTVSSLIQSRISLKISQKPYTCCCQRSWRLSQQGLTMMSLKLETSWQPTTSSVRCSSASQLISFSLAHRAERMKSIQAQSDTTGSIVSLECEEEFLSGDLLRSDQLSSEPLIVYVGSMCSLGANWNKVYVYKINSETLRYEEFYVV